mmetsp:Transcript_30667/g.56568  ORF Transcript_30667/g.56568 Transcript_30667/m.56568 type:complete len:392 (-) Transcript_30667:89-1264(-)
MALPEVPQALQQAGLVVEQDEDGKRLTVRDACPEFCAIRNRGGEALAHLLAQNRDVQALDMRESQISDNGIGQLCLTLRQTDQLEELLLSPVGHVGLEFLIGVVRRCGRLRKLLVEVHDVPTKHQGRQNLAGTDYDTSKYVVEKKEGEEEEEGEEDGEEKKEEEDGEEEEEEREARKLKQLRKKLAEHDFDSDDEGKGGASQVRAASGALAVPGAASPALQRLLSDFVEAVKKKDNLIEVECVGDAVPADLRLDLQRAVEDHQWKEEKRAHKMEEKGARSAHDALKDQMEELRIGLEIAGDAEGSSAVAALLASEGGTAPESEGETTRLGLRSYVNRRLFAALGEALFECQRFKSKENEAVADAKGEMAFIAMYLRKQAKAMAQEKQSPKK